jgi:hypothetical protein
METGFVGDIWAINGMSGSSDGTFFNTVGTLRLRSGQARTAVVHETSRWTPLRDEGIQNSSKLTPRPVAEARRASRVMSVAPSCSVSAT